MKKVYILYNSDIGDVIAVSENKNLLEELMCDYFIDDVNYEWYWRINRSLHPLNENKIHDIVIDVWDEMMEWYNDYMLIFESEVIK